ncbi:MAG: cobalt transporter [Alphaproteobacteria bacterium]|nr:cobalt transporter [Alphaproteobacteria bacterium]
MLRRLLITALVAGLATGVAITALHGVTTVPLILEAETYENGGGHGHAAASAHGAKLVLAHGHEAGPAAAENEGWAPADGIERIGFTLLANLVVATGFGLLLAAAFALRGQPVDLRSGLLWGIAGFAVFQLAPAAGLPPELPGNVAAELGARQMWWLGAAAGAATGLALLAFGKNWAWLAGGIALIALPHIVGAPHLQGATGAVPPELAARYVALSLAVGAVFWALLGGLAGAVWQRLERDA